MTISTYLNEVAKQELKLISLLRDRVPIIYQCVSAYTRIFMCYFIMFSKISINKQDT